MNKRQVLTTHYSTLLRKVATWAGLVALLGTTLVASPAAALGTQMGARSVTPVTIKAAATTSYSTTFKVATTSVVGSMKLEICDSPLESVACVASASAGVNSNGASLVASSFTSLSGTNCTLGTWAVGAGTGPGTSGTSRKLTNSGAAMTPTSANACTLVMGGVVNPTGNNQHYYMRLTTYSDMAYTTEVDFGGFALMTAQDLTVTASVQETLTFCIGGTSSAGCVSPGSGAISLATGTSCPILTTANICTGAAYMAVSTNANAGYGVTFNGSTFTGPSDTIAQFGAAGAVSAPATEQFGLAITAKSGAGSGAAAATYDFGTNGSKYAFQNATITTIASAAAATAGNIFTITYAANVSSVTKPGLFSSIFNYVCTGNF